MKKIIIYLVFLNFISCKEKQIEQNSLFHLDHSITESALNVWLYKGECKNAVENQYNRDMDLLYNHGSGSTQPEFPNPIFGDPFSSNIFELKYLIDVKDNFQDVIIADSIMLKKHFELEKNDKKLINSNVTLIIYKLKSKNKTTLLLNKAMFENKFSNSNEVITPTIKYNYQLKDGNIISNFGYFYSIENNNGFYKFPMEIENIRLENDKLEYDDRTKVYLNYYIEDNSKDGIEVLYE